MSAPRRTIAVAVLVSLAGLAACVGAALPTRFYTLEPATAEPAGRAAVTARTGAGPAIGLGPVVLPAYLDRPEIVTREGAHELLLGELDRWAEPLQPVFVRLLAERLRPAAGGREIVLVPGERGLPDPRYAVGIAVDRFDADETGRVVLDARWRVYDTASGLAIAAGRELVEEQGAAAPDYPAIVAAMARAVDGLAQKVAPAITRTERAPRPSAQRPAPAPPAGPPA